MSFLIGMNWMFKYKYSYQFQAWSCYHEFRLTLSKIPQYYQIRKKNLYSFSIIEISLGIAVPFQFLWSLYSRHFLIRIYYFFVSYPHHAKLRPFCVTPLGEWGVCGIVTAICNCRPFPIVVSILATVACSLRPSTPPPPPLRQQDSVFH
jgi:hypothetical protein